MLKQSLTSSLATPLSTTPTPAVAATYPTSSIIIGILVPVGVIVLILLGVVLIMFLVMYRSKKSKSLPITMTFSNTDPFEDINEHDLAPLKANLVNPMVPEDDDEDGMESSVV
jgi:uncharacterized membrane protein YqiK